MNNAKKLAGLIGVLALGASPALAVAGAPDDPGAAHKPSTTPVRPANSTSAADKGTAHKPATPGPNASAQSKRKAYGKYCQGQSKKHVKGAKGTPFSQCVTAMAKVAHGDSGPKAACKSLSKKHVKGTPGTPYSKCVSAAAKLLEDEAEDGEASASS